MYAQSFHLTDKNGGNINAKKREREKLGGGDIKRGRDGVNITRDEGRGVTAR